MMQKWKMGGEGGGSTMSKIQVNQTHGNSDKK